MKKIYPLLQSQAGIFIEWIAEPSMTKYNLPSYTVFPGSECAEQVAENIRKVLLRHPEMNARFEMVDGEPVQWCDSSREPNVVLRTMTEKEVEPLVNGAWVRPFDLLGSEPLYRVLVVRTEENIHLFFDFHHIIADGYTVMAKFLGELSAISEGRELPAVSDYTFFQAAEDEQQQFGTEAYASAKSYFAEHLAGSEFARMGDAVDNPWGEYLTATAELPSSAVNSWCREHIVSQPLLFNAALAFVLSQLRREQKVCYFTLHHGRNERLADAWGMFVKSLPVSVSIDYSQSVRQFVKSLRKELSQSTRLSSVYPFTHLCRDLQMTPGVSFNYLAHAGEESLSYGGHVYRGRQFPMTLVDRDLEVEVYTSEASFEIRCHGSSALFSMERLQMYATAIHDCVCNMMSDADAPLSSLSIVGCEETSRIMEVSAGKHLDVDVTKTFVDAFEERAEQCPENVSVVDRDGSLTYRELSQWSNALAHRLISEGVVPDSFVCVLLERRKEFPLSVLAIHKAGAAYTPLDFEYPAERLNYMISNSESRVLLTTHDVLDRKKAEGGFDTGDSTVIYLDDMDFTSSGTDCSPVNLTSPDRLAYMIYTSGSTGKPKGAMLHQAGLWNFINVVIDMEGLTAADRIEGHRSFSFDAHIEDMYAILTLGGSFHIMPSEIRKDPAAMRDFIVSHGITGGGYSTAVGALLVNTYPDLPVRFITAGGEKLEGVYSDHIEIINVYGPTECTDDTSYYKIRPGERISNIPIGKSVANTWNFIVGPNGQLLPLGAEGELCFAGIQVGRGYWQLPERTAQSFVDCPFVTSDAWGRPVRMYHTGDLCRWNSDGDLEYISRIDMQVKLRGFRIELGEIESHAMQLDGMLQVAAEVKKIGVGEHLCLYYSLADGASLDEDTIRSHMKNSSLADYMVPTLYVEMATMPLTPNGKINRKALPLPALTKEEIVLAETDGEKQLFGLVAELLKTDQFGVNTNLISVGLTSLTAMKLSARLASEGITLSTKQILSTPFIRELAKVAVTEAAPAVHGYEKREYYPMTESVRALFLDWEAQPEAIQYNVPRVSILHHVDVARLQTALVATINAHPFLKMRFAENDGEIMMQRRDESEVSVPVIELDQSAEPTKDFFQGKIRPFDLLHDDLYRIEIYRHAGTAYLFTDFHHTVLDGTSLQIFLSDVARSYNGESLGDEPFTAFDHAVEEGDLTSEDKLAAEDAYFDKLFSGKDVTVYPYSELSDLELENRGIVPAGSADAVREIGTMRHAFVDLDGDEIREFCRVHGVTESNYFLTTTMMALSRLTGQKSVVLTANTNGRSAAHLQQAVGMFVTSLPLVLDEVDPSAPLSETVKAVQRQTQETYSLDYYPFLRLANRYGMRSEIVFLYQGGINDAEHTLGGEKYDGYMLTLDSAKDPLTIEPFPNDKGGYTMLLEYDGSLYNKTDMTRLAKALTTFAAEAVRHNDDIRGIPLLSQAEAVAMLSLSKGREMPVVGNSTFPSLFSAQASKTPRHIAVVDDTVSYTYSEVEKRSNAFARYLAGKGVRAGEFVCISMPNSADFVVCAIGIEKAGAAYVPVDPEYPEERKQFMQEDCEAKIIVTEDTLSECDWSNDSALDQSTPAGIAYMIYTSGSTGKPKGVMIPHSAKSAFVQFIAAEWGHDESSRICCHSSFSFDASVEDLYPVLTVGGTLYVVPQSARKDLSLLHDYIVSNGITGGCYTTQLGQMLLQMYPDLPVKYLVVGGEKMTSAPACQCRLINTYGPTEFTVDATFFDVEAGKEYKNIPIGRPLYNQCALVLDAYGHLVPQGVSGELCMSGSQMAAGYWKREELTAEKFASVPALADGTPVYHTGDLVRYNEDGQIEYLGRIDSQVKLRGFRIELGEIETLIASYPGVTMESVQVQEVGGVQHLCAYYTADKAIDESAMRAYLSESLTDYMVPTAYIQLDEMPLTPNGKVDTKALPLPEIKAEERVAPATDTERELFRITAELLRHEDFGVTSNLISMGLTSLSAMRLAMTITQQMGVQISTKDILSDPTLRSVAAKISDGKNATTSDAPTVEFAKRKFYPLTENQRGLVIDWEMNKDALQYNIPGVNIYKKIDAVKLRDAYIAAVNAHPILKAKVVKRHNDVMLARHDDEIAVVTLTDVSQKPDKEFLQSRVRPFDIFSDTLYRIELYKYGEDVYAFWDFHHIVYDGVSSYNFQTSVITAYMGLTLKPEQYSAYEHSLEETAMMETEHFDEAEAYFGNLLSGVETTHYPASDVSDGTAERESRDVRVSIPRNAIDVFCKTNGITPNNYFITALCNVLHRLLREDDVLITTINNGRNDQKMEDIVGMFVKTIPVVLHLGESAGKTFASVAKEMQKQFFETISNDFYPFTTMVEKYGIRPEIMFDFIADYGEADMPVDMDFMPLGLNTVMTPVAVSAITEKDSYVIRVEYDGSLYCQSDMLILANTLAHYAMSATETEVTLRSIPLLSPEESASVLSLSKGREMPVVGNSTFPSLFSAQASKTPRHIAVVDDTVSYTYSEVEKRSNAFARYLAGKGVRAGEFVCISMPNSADFVVCAIGIEKAGAAYVPVDPEYPEERKQFMQEDCEAKIIVTEDTLSECDWSNDSALDQSTPAGIAYMIYTSGSTGKPKGVMIPHSAKSAFVQFIAAEWGHDESSRICCHSSFSFDASVEDLYPVLTVGGTLYVVPQSARKDLSLLHDYIVSNGITGGCYTTQLGQMLLQMYPDLPVKYLVVGGEKMTSAPACQCRLINTYGPTEFTVDATFFDVEAGKEYKNIPIGRPLYNQCALVLDAYGHLVPQGVSGELCMSGSQMAAGYWKREELTAEKFASVPALADGTPVYHTGDLVRYNEDGQIEYLGRIDSQVKLRGFRIELGEIETLIASYPGVTMESVQVQEVGGVQHLCAYYTADKAIDESAMRAYLSESLTDYMVPTAYIQLDEMPLTPNGKVDTKALPLPEIKAEERVAPATDTERELFRITAELLRHEDFGVTSNLISMGLTSLSAMRLAMTITQQMGVQISTKDIMKAQNLRALAHQIEGNEEVAQSVLPTETEIALHDDLKHYYYPITENQRGVYIDWELNRDAIQYNIPIAERYKGIDASRLCDALTKAIDAHPSMKTRLVMYNGDVHMIRRDREPAVVTLETIDFDPSKDFFQKLVKPFDLFNDRLYRIKVYQSPDAVYLFRDLHHVIFDGASDAYFMNDVMSIYNGEDVQTETYTFFDKALDEFDNRDTLQIAEADKYFGKLLEECTTTTYPHSSTPDGLTNAFVESSLDKAVVDEFCKKNGVTNAAYFMTIVMSVLSRLTREKNVQIVTVDNGRDSLVNPYMTGMFVRTLPIVLRESGTKTVAEVAKETQGQFFTTAGYTCMPFTRLVEKYSIHPEVMFNFVVGDFDSKESDIAVQDIELELGTAKMPITINVIGTSENTYKVTLDYNGMLYNKHDMSILADSISGFAEKAAICQGNLSDLSYISDEEIQELITLGKGKTLDFDTTETIVSIFRKTAEKTPDAPCVVYDNRMMTYGEVDSLTDNMAVMLSERYGVGHETPVGVLIDRSEYMLIYPLAVMKAGGTYMPLDFHFPEDRLMFMCEDAGVKLILSEDGLASRIMPSYPGTIWEYNEEKVEAASADQVKALHTPLSDMRMVILYTSGSTGKPKGVELEHHGLVNFCHWYATHLNMTPSDRVSAYANFGFDAHMLDMYPTMTAGACLYILRNDLRNDLTLMNQYMEEKGITVAFFTTQIGCLMIQMNNTLRVLGTGGEKMPPVTPPPYTFFNFYGPTETSIISNYYQVTGYFEGEYIGKSIDNVQLFIIDAERQLVPRGIAGELLICGTGVARGYLNRPELTAEKFIEFRGMKAYRTGDLVRWADNGEMEFLGRIDNQVKMRGLRIELGEIENQIATFDGIKQVVVDVKTVSGVQMLCAYYTLAAGYTPAADYVDKLTGHLKEHLAEFMVPSQYFCLDSMPLTSNGKVNKRELPMPELQSTELYVEPANKTEYSIARSFARILNISDPIGALDSFFALGGDSIKAIRLVSALREDGIVMRVADVMKLKTVRAIAEYVGGADSQRDAISQEPWSGEVPSTAITDYFFRLDMPKPEHFNQSSMMKATQPVSPTFLRAAMDAIVRHHDMLRAVVREGKLFVRDISEPHLYDFYEYDLTSQSSHRDCQDKITTLTDEIQRTINLETGPLCRAALFHTTEGDQLFITVHHLVIDGVSWRIINEDLLHAYTALKNDEQVTLPSKTNSYKDYANALQTYLSDGSASQYRTYWDDVRTSLKDIGDEDYSTGNDYSREMSSLTFTLDVDTTFKLLHQSNEAFHTDTNDLLLTALGRAFESTMNKKVMAIQMEGHGREDFSETLIIDRTVGWFTSIYPVVLGKLGADIRHDICNVKERLHRIPRKGFDYGQLYGIDLEKEPQVGFNFLGEIAEGVADGDALFVTSPFSVGRDIAEENVFGTDILINCSVIDGRLSGTIDYNTQRYSDQPMQALRDRLLEELANVVCFIETVKTPQVTATDLGEYQWTQKEFEMVWRNFEKRGETIERIYPLTSMQEAMLLKCLSDPEDAAYRITTAYEFDTVFTEEQLRYALDCMAEKHEVLRTSIICHDTTVSRQAIVKRSLGLAMVDVSGDADPQETIRQINASWMTRPLDLETMPLFNIVCCKTSENTSTILIVFHHVIADGWCMQIINTDLLKFLVDAKHGNFHKPEPGVKGRYESHVRDIKSRNTTASLRYWHDLLDNYETKTEIPSTGTVSDDERVDKGYLDIYVPEDKVQKLSEICRKEQITLNSAVELALGLVLQTWNRTEDSVFVKVVSGRDSGAEDLTDLVGLCINSVPVRVKTDGGKTVRQALLDMHRQAIETKAHDYIPLSDILAQTDLGSDLFHVIMGFENFPSDDSVLTLSDEFHVKESDDFTVENNISDLSVKVFLDDKRLNIGISFDNSIYRRAEIETVLETFSQAVCAIADHPDSVVSDLDLVDEPGAVRLLAMSKGDDVCYDKSETFIDVFLQRVKEAPDHLAVIEATMQGRGGTYTYGQLDEESDIIANRLIAQGICQNDFVAIMLPRRKEFFASVIGVQKAGAAYVPVDPEYPEDRRQYMIDDAEAKVVITEDWLADNACSKDSTPVNRATADTLAYMIYTSGSTGKPKGCMLSHRAIRACMEWNVTEFGLGPSKRNIHLPSFSFDASTFDLFYPLAAGAEVHLLDEDLRKDMDGMARYVAANGITGMTMSTALGLALLNQYDLPIEYIMLGGEKFTPVKKTAARLYNGYGPTEFTVCSSFHVIDQDKDVNIPIGRAVPGSWSFVCDSHGHLVPQGVPGELLLSGDQIAEGYWHRDDITAERFIDLHVGDKTFKAYRTGDLVRYNGDGELEFLGRIDNQVKLRGFRIEMGEIENQASLYEGVLSVAAEVITMGSSQMLCLYYTAKTPVLAETMREFLGKTLTDYMVPSVYVQLDTMPLTPNGKINRRLLPMPELSSQMEKVKPENLKEHILFDIAAKLLGTTDFGVTDDLSRVGMTSLMGIKFVMMAGSHGINIKLSDLMREGTIRKVLTTVDTFAFWAKAPEANRRNVVVVCGETSYEYLQSYIKALAEHFNVFVIEPITEHYDYLFNEDDINEVVNMYLSVTDTFMDYEVKVDAFTGHCFGGELVYRMAAEYNRENGTQVPAVMLDSFWRTTSDVVDLEALVSLFPDKFRPQLEEIFNEREGIVEMYRHLGSEPEPPYKDVPVVLFRAMEPEPMQEELIPILSECDVDMEEVNRLFNPDRQVNNEEYWLQHLSNIRVKRVFANHMSMLYDRYVGKYVELLKEITE